MNITNIKLSRIKKGMTQAQLRTKAKISPNKMVAIEKGNYDNLTYEQMNRIADVLETPVQELFFDK